MENGDNNNKEPNENPFSLFAESNEENNNLQKEEEKKDNNVNNQGGLFSNMANLDKGNISEQIGLDFDLPSQTQVEKQFQSNNQLVMNPQVNQGGNNPYQNPNQNDFDNYYGLNNNPYGNNNNMNSNPYENHQYYSPYGNNNPQNNNQNQNISNNNFNNNYNNPPYNYPNYPPTNNNNNNNNLDIKEKKVLEILNSCEQHLSNSIVLFKSRQINEAKQSLLGLIKALDGLSQSLKVKQITNPSFPPRIANIYSRATKTLFIFSLQTYTLTQTLFKYSAFDQTDDLAKYAQKYILTRPFITFEDIFDPEVNNNNSIKNQLMDAWFRTQRTNHKNLLLYGPQGSGKTLTVHALAHEIGGKIVQIEGSQLFQIPYFVKELARVAFDIGDPAKPLVFFVRNIESLFGNNSLINAFNWLFDKLSCDKRKVIFVTSACSPPQLIPRDIAKKFYYPINIRPALAIYKCQFLKFVLEKLGVKLEASENEIQNFAQKLESYSNGDIFNVIKMSIDLKKQNFPGDEHPEIIDINIMNKAVSVVPASLTPQIKSWYYL